MRRFILFLIALIVAVLIGVLVADVPGLVIIQLSKTNIIFPVWLGVVLLVVVSILLTWLWRIFRLLLKITK